MRKVDRPEMAKTLLSMQDLQAGVGRNPQAAPAAQASASIAINHVNGSLASMQAFCVTITDLMAIDHTETEEDDPNYFGCLPARLRQ